MKNRAPPFFKVRCYLNFKTQKSFYSGVQKDSYLIHLYIVSCTLADSYFDRRLPSNYRCRRSVSRLSSRWMSVGPQRHRHQEYALGA